MGTYPFRAPTMENFLISLPIILAIWTGVTFVCGIMLAMLLKKIAYTSHGGRHPTDHRNFIIILLVSVVLAGYLFLPAGTFGGARDSIIVINVFYNYFLICVGIGIARWWSSYEARPCVSCPLTDTCTRTTEDPKCDKAHYHNQP